MADFTTTPNRSGLGWIIGVAVVVLLLLFALYGGGSVSPDAESDAAPAVETPPASAEPAPASTD